MTKKYQLSPLEQYIYDRLIDGIAQVNIKKHLFKKIYGYSWKTFENRKDITLKEHQKIDWKLKGMVSYYTKKLMEKKLVEPVSKKARPCIYHATCISPSKREPFISVEEKSDWQEQSVLIDEEVVEKDIMVARLIYRYNVIDPPCKEFKWDKINDKLRSGVVSYYTTYPCDIGVINIRYDVSPRGKKDIYITLPMQSIPPEQHDEYIKVLNGYACKAGAYVQRLLGCRLGLPTVASKRDYYVPVREPGVKKFLKDANIRLLNKNGTHMDSSPPLCEPHFESGSFDEAKCYSELPGRMLRVENTLERIEKSLERTVSSLEFTRKIQDEIKLNVDELLGISHRKDDQLKKDNLDMYG